MELDSENLQREEAQFRSTQASTMVPMSTEPTHIIVDHSCAWRDRSTPSRVSVCPQHRNTARRAAADHGASGVFPGVEDPGSGYGRVPQRALK